MEYFLLELVQVNSSICSVYLAAFGELAQNIMAVGYLPDPTKCSLQLHDKFHICGTVGRPCVILS